MSEHPSSYGRERPFDERVASSRPLQIGNEISNFTGDSHMGVITLHSFIDGGWGVILTYPRNNDPVTCTELGMLSKMSQEFEERNCKVLAIGVDSKMAHRRFIEERQDCIVTFPIIADATGEIFSRMGLVRRKEDTIDPARGLVPQTSVFVIDLDLRVRMIVHYPVTVGHNYYETIRAIDALQQATFNRVRMPCQLEGGRRCPRNSEHAGATFPKGYVELQSWFRLTPQPDYD